MAGRVRSLQVLQKIDDELARAQDQLDSLISALREPDELVRARERESAIAARSTELRRRLRDQELDLEAVREKLATEEGRLYEGKVTQPRELTGLEQEVQSLKRRRTRLEDEVLELMVAQEEAEAELRQTRAAREGLEEQWEADRTALKAEEARLRQQVTRLADSRQEQAGSLDPQDLAAYEDLRRRKGGQAVVSVVSGVCGGCGVAIPASQVQRILRGKEPIRCDNCERILTGEAG